MNHSSRRQFLHRSFAAVTLGLVAPCSWAIASAPNQKLKAAIIGDTGHGSYGHDLDLVFNDLPSVEVVAVADPDAAGRAKAAARCYARRQYADYHQMLESERPTLVSVAPRWTDQHCAMALAALQIGAHLYMEKPFTQTLAEADALLAEASRKGLKIAVAHQMHLGPSIPHLKKELARGLIGDLMAIHAYGKQDSRAGGEDMVVLGTHLFDLMRLFAGDPLWCTARIMQNGHEITPSDIHPATENIGPIAGDEIEAQFAFPNRVQGTFTSRGRYQKMAGPWGLLFVGSRGRVRLLMDMVPAAYYTPEAEWPGENKNVAWQRLPGDPALDLPASERGFAAANRRVINDWLSAIQDNREPQCSGLAARQALEMIMAVFQAGLSRSRVAFPLAIRQHPFIP